MRPLPCDYASTTPMTPSSALVIADQCLPEGGAVTVRVKIGAYFSIQAPSALEILKVVFDFSDSLLPWGSPCASLRSESCMVSHS